jgi:hypothetical protein
MFEQKTRFSSVQKGAGGLSVSCKKGILDSFPKNKSSWSFRLTTNFNIFTLETIPFEICLEPGQPTTKQALIR